MEGMTPNNNNNNSCTTRSQDLEKKSRPQEQLNCPRCNSTNTKFCYYNNYSLTQPRYFCKTCRRYWTEGGSLRNVPVGGGSRKNKKINNNSSLSLSLPVSAPVSSPSVAATIASSKGIITHQNLINPNKMLQGGGQDLNLAFSMDKYHHHGFSPLPFVDNSSSSSSSSPSYLSALELLRSSMASRGLSPLANNHPLIPNSSNSLYPSLGFPMQEVNKVNNNNSLGFFMDHEMMGNNHRSNYDDNVQENINNGGRVLFPFGEVKQQHLSSSGGDDHHEVENNKEQEGNPSNGYWTGIIGEGSW